METILIPNMCRICLKSGSSKLLSLYRTDDEEDDSPRAMLAKLTGIDLEDEHLLTELPKKICKSCMCEMNLSFQFLEKALQAQSQIEQYLELRENKKIRKTTDDVNEKMEADEMNAATVTESLQFEQNQENSPMEEIEEILDDQCDEILESTVNERLNNEVIIENDLFKKQAVRLRTNDSNIKNGTKRTRCKKDSTNQNENKPTLEEREEPFKPSKRGRKPKIEGSSSILNASCHVCEICGNVFAKRGRLTEHLRRHETEAKYACELCDERFLLREALRRHMFQHLGGKPFKCDFCSRTFFYESVKKAHEAIHAGHKPYVCDKCNKAFAYPHALKKHKLIHDDIKLFSCQYCKKDFRLQHHMKQHEETKAHINAVQQQKNL